MNRTMYSRAYDWAVDRYAGLIYSNAPMIFHAERVALDAGMDAWANGPEDANQKYMFVDFVKAAGVLHDLVEEKRATLAEIRDAFGIEMANAVGVRHASAR